MLDAERAEPLAPPVDSRAVRLAELLGVRDVGRALRDFLAYLPTQLIPALAAFVALPLLARRLAPTELGVLAIAQTLVSLGWIVSSQWLTSAVMRELPAHRADGRVAVFRAGLARGLGLTGLAFGGFSALLLLASIVSSAIGDNVALILAAAAGLVVQNLSGTLFQASLRPRLFAALELLSRTGGIALGIKLVWDGHGVGGYLFGLAAASLLVGTAGLALGWPRGDGKAAAGERVRLRAWAAYGSPIAVSAVVLWALSYVDRYLLGLLKTTGDVGVYAVGYVVGEKSVMIPALAFFVAARPLLIAAFERQGREEVERLMRAYTRVMVLLGLPVIGFVAIASGKLVPFLSTGFYPNYYEPAADVAPVVAGGIFLQALALIGSTGLTVGRRTGLLLRGSVLALAANVIANLALIPPFGIMGAAAATVVGTAVFLAATRIWAARYATWQFPLPTLARASAAVGAGVAAALLLMRLPDSDLADVAIAAGAGGVVYAVALFALGELGPLASGRD